MQRKRRTTILVNADLEFLAAFAAEVTRSVEVFTVMPAQAGLVMVRMRETARESVFFPGEVLVTQAQVRIGSTLGTGLIQGREPERALQLAILDAAWNSGLALVQTWTARLEAEEARQLQLRNEKARQIARTLVDFQSLDQEAV